MHQFQAMYTADRSNLKMKITGYDFSLDQKNSTSARRRVKLVLHYTNTLL